VVQLGSAVGSSEGATCAEAQWLAVIAQGGLNPRSARWWLSGTSPACTSLVFLLGAGRGGESASSFPATWMEIPQNSFRLSPGDAGRSRRGMRCKRPRRVSLPSSSDSATRRRTIRVCSAARCCQLQKRERLQQGGLCPAGPWLM